MHALYVLLFYPLDTNIHSTALKRMGENFFLSLSLTLSFDFFRLTSVVAIENALKVSFLCYNSLPQQSHDITLLKKSHFSIFLFLSLSHSLSYYFYFKLFNSHKREWVQETLKFF
jgi:hypothetical protein